MSYNIVTIDKLRIICGNKGNGIYWYPETMVVAIGRTAAEKFFNDMRHTPRTAAPIPTRTLTNVRKHGAVEMDQVGRVSGRGIKIYQAGQNTGRITMLSDGRKGKITRIGKSQWYATNEVVARKFNEYLSGFGKSTRGAREMSEKLGITINKNVIRNMKEAPRQNKLKMRERLACTRQDTEWYT